MGRRGGRAACGRTAHPCQSDAAAANAMTDSADSAGSLEARARRYRRQPFDRRAPAGVTDQRTVGERRGACSRPRSRARRGSGGRRSQEAAGRGPPGRSAGRRRPRRPRSRTIQCPSRSRIWRISHPPQPHPSTGPTTSHRAQRPRCTPERDAQDRPAEVEGTTAARTAAGPCQRRPCGPWPTPSNVDR